MIEHAVQHELPPAELAVLGEQIFCDDDLGLAWTVLDEKPEEAKLARMNARNEVVLRTLALVEEHDETQVEDAERAELHRLEAKLNLVLELLADLISEGQGTLPRRAVRFNSKGLCWQSEEALEPNALLIVRCYAQPAWPVPLKLIARVRSSLPSRDGFRICSHLEEMSFGAANWLEKLVFRRHRRSIARSRAVPRIDPTRQ